MGVIFGLLQKFCNVDYTMRVTSKKEGDSSRASALSLLFSWFWCVCFCKLLGHLYFDHSWPPYFFFLISVYSHLSFRNSLIIIKLGGFCIFIRLVQLRGSAEKVFSYFPTFVSHFVFFVPFLQKLFSFPSQTRKSCVFFINIKQKWKKENLIKNKIMIQNLYKFLSQREKMKYSVSRI